MKIDGVLLKKTEEYREKNGIYVTDEKSKSYIGFKLAATLSFVWVITTNILVAISFLYLYSSGMAKGDLQTPITVSAITLGIIAGYIFSVCGNHYVGAPLTTVSNATAFFLFMKLQTDVAGTYEIGLQESFYYRHAIPLVLFTICILALAYIGIRAKLSLKRDAKTVIYKLYETYKSKNPDFSEGDWHKYLKSLGISEKTVEKL